MDLEAKLINMPSYDVQQSGRLFLAHIRKYNNALALASIGCKEHGRLFLAHIRKYNNALALASIGGKEHERLFLAHIRKYNNALALASIGCKEHGRLFLAHIRKYNNALALASIGCKEHGRLFLAHIRKYNNALALASIGCKEHVHDGFNSTFTIQGKLYHRMGNLLPERGETPKFSQIYFHESDIDTEVDNRLTHAELDRHILQELQSTLQTLCKFVSQVFQDIHRGGCWTV